MEDWTLSYCLENIDHCNVILSEKSNWYSIPDINNVRDYTEYDKRLVRFLCMVQDIHNPQFEDNDAVTNGENNPIRSMQMILPLYCIRIPALRPWAEEFRYMEISSHNHDNRSNEKRVLEDCNENSEETSGENKKSCTRNDTNLSGESDSVSDTSCYEKKKLEDCIIFLNGTLEEKVKLNDVIEVAGFLCAPPSDSDNDKSLITYSKNEYNTWALYAIACTPYTIRFPIHTTSEIAAVKPNAVTIRDKLWLWLSQVFTGDILAADYVICHLLSSVFCRHGTSALGKFSLNISNIPYKECDSSYVSLVYKFLSMLVEKIEYFDVSIENLNNTTMVPKKEVDDDSLKRGFLQLSSKTHLFLNETELKPGTLQQRGVENVNALNSIIENQNLRYDVEYCNLLFDTNIPVLSLSVGKSLLKTDCHVVLQPHLSCIRQLNDTFENLFGQPYHALHEMRKYIDVVRSLEYSVPHSIEEVMENDFVKLRQDDGSFTPDEFKTMLDISKYLSLSKGRDVLQVEDWKHAVKMELERKARLSGEREKQGDGKVSLRNDIGNHTSFHSLIENRDASATFSSFTHRSKT